MPKKSEKNHVTDLKKRTSNLSKSYDDAIGPGIAVFSRSKLPQVRQVLQRYRSIRAEQYQMPVSTIAKDISKDIIEIWKTTTIPYKSPKPVVNSVQRLIERWNNMKPEDHVSQKTKSELDTLFDIRPSNVLVHEGLESYLKKIHPACCEEELKFFAGQKQHPQTTCISTRTDELKLQMDKEKAKRASQAEEYRLRNNMSLEETSAAATGASRKSSNAVISEQSILSPMSKRSRRQTSYSKVIEGDDQEVLKDEEDEEWQPKMWKRYATKDKEILLKLPAKKIPSLLASTSTTTKTSIRQELKLVATLMKGGGAEISDTAQSISTIYRQRRSTITEKAAVIRKKVNEAADEFLVAHWDSKIIQVMSGKTEDRLAICISSPNKIAGQFLASPELPSGTGESMANASFDCLHGNHMDQHVQAVVFDTTSSNSGQWRGSVALFEKLIKRAMLWLACRHHISELHIKHANEAVRGPSKGPDDPLFKRFREIFGTIDVEDKVLWRWPVDDGDWRKLQADTVLGCANAKMKSGTWKREDYRELLELVVIFLGGVTKRLRNGVAVPINVSIRKPGAIHQARFMASCLYIIKMSLFLHQDGFNISASKQDEVQILAEFVALVYAPYFLKSPLAIAAPRLDRDLWNDLHLYKACFLEGSKQHKIYEAVKSSILHHLWYITEELVVFAFFDEELSVGERRAMAEKLIVTAWPRTFEVGKPGFPIEKMHGEPKLDVFIGERSWLLFKKLNARCQWLELPVQEWSTDEEFRSIKMLLADLKVVNDPAERCIKDIQEYCHLTMDPEYREDILIVATDHRGIFQDLRKQSLERL